ncbi:Uncharacterised protein [Mycobacteroides abscessus subsp. abscessus]|nr:Uncharacterised protein [Mycobacteroides abscessus subsp. abscessus]
MVDKSSYARRVPQGSSPRTSRRKSFPLAYDRALLRSSRLAYSSPESAPVGSTGVNSPVGTPLSSTNRVVHVAKSASERSSWSSIVAVNAASAMSSLSKNQMMFPDAAASPALRAGATPLLCGIRTTRCAISPSASTASARSMESSPPRSSTSTISSTGACWSIIERTHASM